MGLFNIFKNKNIINNQQTAQNIYEQRNYIPKDVIDNLRVIGNNKQCANVKDAPSKINNIEKPLLHETVTDDLQSIEASKEYKEKVYGKSTQTHFFSDNSAEIWIIYVKFGKSRSTSYSEAVSLAQTLPNYSINENVITCGVKELNEYLIYYSDFEYLIELVKRWKTSKIFFYNKPYQNASDFWEYREKITNEAGKYAILLQNKGITVEHLPFPIVYYPTLYGAFFGFSKDIGEKIYFCECEREAIENYVKLRKQMPLKNYTGLKTAPLGTDYFPETVSQLSVNRPDDPLSLFGFKKNICFLCNHKIPRLEYCIPMYGSKFKQHYGWYINQEYFRVGIDPYQILGNNILSEKCPDDIYNILKTYLQIKEQATNSPENDNLQESLQLYNSQFHDAIENSFRVRLGFKKVGESWASETLLYYIVKGLFPNTEIIFHYRAKWLEWLELDIYLPEKKIAFEYQGIQHFQPIEHWGGEQQLLKQQKNDEKKYKLCIEHDIKLIYVNYNEPLTEANIKAKLASYSPKMIGS